MRRTSIAFALTTIMAMVAAQVTGVAQDRRASTAANDETALRATLRAITLQKEALSTRDLDSTLREGCEPRTPRYARTRFLLSSASRAARGLPAERTFGSAGVKTVASSRNSVPL